MLCEIELMFTQYGVNNSTLSISLIIRFVFTTTMYAASMHWRLDQPLADTHAQLYTIVLVMSKSSNPPIEILEPRLRRRPIQSRIVGAAKWLLLPLLLLLLLHLVVSKVVKRWRWGRDLGRQPSVVPVDWYLAGCNLQSL